MLEGFLNRGLLCVGQESVSGLAIDVVHERCSLADRGDCTVGKLFDASVRKLLAFIRNLESRSNHIHVDLDARCVHLLVELPDREFRLGKLMAKSLGDAVLDHSVLLAVIEQDVEVFVGLLPGVKLPDGRYVIVKLFQHKYVLRLYDFLPAPLVSEDVLGDNLKVSLERSAGFT